MLELLEIELTENAEPGIVQSQALTQIRINQLKDNPQATQKITYTTSLPATPDTAVPSNRKPTPSLVATTPKPPLSLISQEPHCITAEAGDATSAPT